MSQEEMKKRGPVDKLDPASLCWVMGCVCFDPLTNTPLSGLELSRHDFGLSRLIPLCDLRRGFGTKGLQEKINLSKLIR